MPALKLADMDPIANLTKEFQNFVVGDAKVQENNNILRQNQNIQTEEKRAVIGKVINTQIQRKAEFGTEESSAAQKGTEAKPKDQPPVFTMEKLTRLRDFNLTMEKLTRMPEFKEVMSSCLKLRARGPQYGINTRSGDRDDDSYSGAKYMRPNRSFEGAVEELHTPDVELQELVFRAKGNVPSPDYKQQASPADSGIDSPWSTDIDSPRPADIDNAELPSGVLEIIHQIFNGERQMTDIENKLLNLSPESATKALSVIDALFAQQNATCIVDAEYLNDDVQLDSAEGDLMETFQNDVILTSSIDTNNPSLSVVVPVPVTFMSTTQQSPSCDSHQRRPASETHSLPDAKQALQQHINNKMRTEPYLAGFGGLVRPMSDISNFVQNLSPNDKEDLEKSKNIIETQSETECTKIDEDGDTLLHLYMIHSPEKEVSSCPPRRKMKLLLYCLLVRLNEMGKLTGPNGLIDRKNDKGQTPLYIAACVVNFPFAVEMFLHFGADPNIRLATKDLDGPAPIHKVLERGDDCLETLYHLLADSRCDPNLLNNGGMTPLMIACRAHGTQFRSPDTGEIAAVTTLKCVRALLNSPRVDAFAKNMHSGRAAIHYAVEKGSVDLIRVWEPFASRCSPDETTSAKDGTKLKLINVTDGDGNNVLHTLAGLQLPSSKTQMEIAELLLAMKADVTKRNGDKKIPRDLARTMKNHELAASLIMPKPRKSSNNSCRSVSSKSSKSSHTSSDSPPTIGESFDYSQTVYSQNSPGNVFANSFSDSSQRYSPPTRQSPTQSAIQTEFVPAAVYNPNGGPFVFGAQNTYAMSGGQSFGQAGDAPQMGAGRYTTVDELLLQQALGRNSPSGVQTTPALGQFAVAGGIRSAGGQFHGGRSPFGGQSPQGAGQFSPSHSGGQSPQRAGQYSPPHTGGRSPLGAGQYSPESVHSSHSSRSYSPPGGSPLNVGQYSPNSQSHFTVLPSMNVVYTTAEMVGHVSPAITTAPMPTQYVLSTTLADQSLFHEGDANPFVDVLTHR